MSLLPSHFRISPISCCLGGAFSSRLFVTPRSFHQSLRRLVFIRASWPLANLPFKLQASCPASPSRGSAHRNHQKEFVLPHSSVRRLPSNLRTRMETTTSCRALEMYIIRTSPVPDNAKDIRSPNPQESKHSPTLSPFSLPHHLRSALVNSTIVNSVAIEENHTSSVSF